MPVTKNNYTLSLLSILIIGSLLGAGCRTPGPDESSTETPAPIIEQQMEAKRTPPNPIPTTSTPKESPVVSTPSPVIKEDIVACTSDAWECGEFSECSEGGKQSRSCMIKDTSCSNPAAVKPVETQDCAPIIKETNNAPEVKEFQITAKQWNFIPSVIEVNKGDRVKLSITSVDVEHGFSLTPFGVNEKLHPNETVNVEFVADIQGSFTFFCSVFCGSGHSSMKGTLIVK